MTLDRNNTLCYPGTGGHDEIWGMTVTTAGKQTVLPGSGYPLRSHPADYLFSTQKGRILNEYQIVYIVNGSGTFCSGNRPPRKVTSGSVLFLFPDEWHTYSPDKETGWEEYWVGFRSRYIDSIIAKRSITKEEPVHNIGISTGIISLYEEIISVLQHEKPGHLQLVASIIIHILGSIYFKEKNLSYADTATIEKINEARMLMKDPECRLSTEGIAESVGIGYSKFRKIFKEYTGVPPTQYRLQQKLSKAKELLTSSMMNISEISYTLKFDNPCQFSIFFKNREGISPSEFRERNRMR